MEICEEIYANVEVTTDERFNLENDKNSHEDIYINENKPQTSSTRSDQNKNSGCETAGSRLYRGITVGLLLFCVLLLAVIIVLAVKKDQFQTSYKNLTIEKDQLQASYKTLTIEKDRLQTSYKTLTIEKDQLQTSYKTLTIEKDQLQTSYKTLTIEKDQLQTSYKTLTIEKDQLQTSYKTLTIEKDQLQTSYKTLSMEKDQLQKKNDKCQSVVSYLEQRCTYFKSSVYSITTEKKSWSASRQDCKQRGADLVIIDSKEEQNFISGCFPKTQAWIGLNDIDREGKWMWVDGTALNTGFWWDGEPNSYGGNEDCVATGYEKAKYPLKNWNDFPCDFSVVGICERKF